MNRWCGSSLSSRHASARLSPSSCSWREQTVAAASDLLSKLSGERSRWAQQLAAPDGQLADLPRPALAAAAFITYLPAHPEDVQEWIMQGWTSLLKLASFSLAGP